MSKLTQVGPLRLEKQIANRIRCGRTVDEYILDHNRRDASFAAGGIFASLRSTSHGYRTVLLRIDILHPVGPGERYSTACYVRPDEEILLRICDWPKVDKVLQTIDGIEARCIDPADAAPADWRHVHSRLSVGEQPRPRTRHRDWRHRKVAT
jgi:Protein of unknown function (DUF2840)